MKTKQKLISIMLLVMIGLVMQSCKKETVDPDPDNKMPTKFAVDIPSSLSRDESAQKDILSDTLNGNVIYWHLSTFIYATEKSAEFVQQIIIAISTYNINHPMTFSYINQDDGRVKNVTVIENSSYEGTTWQFQLTITDALSETNADGGNALQVFWNTNPVKGIAVLKVYNADRVNWVNYPDVMYSVYYSEAGEGGYSNQMLVSLAELPLDNPLDNAYSMQSMKMFAGKNGDYIDVYGNSNHPNAKFFTTQTGFNWAFAASCNTPLNIAVAEVGIPLNTLNSSDRIVLLKDNSIKNVFTDQIYETWPAIDSIDVANYLYNTEPPGYFDSNGFMQGGVSPGSNYQPIEQRMNLLSPFNPVSISNLTIEFKP